MKNNYPIKYAVIPIIEQYHYPYESEETVCYIVSKCYLVAETKKYNQNGSVDKKYQVVCPYTEKEFDIWNRVEPSYNFDGTCLNGLIVDAIYNNYEDAKKDKDDKNHEIVNKKISCVRVNNKMESNIKKIKDEFNEKLSFYDKLESLIEANTEDLIVNAEFKERSVIYGDNKEYCKYNSSLYHLIKLFENNTFIVYNLSSSEYLELQTSLHEGKDIHKFNHTPLLINNPSLRLTKILLPDNKEKYLANGNIIDSIDLDFISPSQYSAVFYTIEDYQDIINTYKKIDDKVKVIKLNG